MIASQQPIILSVQNLNVQFKTKNQTFLALNSVSFDIKAGQTLALIGQSGSGKSVTSLAIMGLLEKNASISGKISLCEYQNLLQSSQETWSQVRGKFVSMIFQEPMSALNPVKTCGYQLVESIKTHQRLTEKQAKKLAVDWLDKVKLPTPELLFHRYPHQLSGGQKQRVMIAMAMCNRPALLIADEPTTALDVTVQQEIITLMKDLQQEFGTAILFITHDLALARTLTTDFLMMEQGKIVDKPFPIIEVNQKKIEPDNTGSPLLSVQNVTVSYANAKNWLGKSTGVFTAVDNVSFDLWQGQTIGLVGESGCGKSTLCRSILGLQPVNSGKIIFEDKNITAFNREEWRYLRKDVQIIFQDPYASLNQRIKIVDAIAEPLLVHRVCNTKNVENVVKKLLEDVELPKSAMQKYPHEFSGGQRQRICIARALAIKPKLVVCDEIVAALDIKIQQQILQLLNKLQQEYGLTYIFITHDLHVVQQIADHVLVMEKGKIVESGFTNQVLYHPVNSYTQKLINAAPQML